MARLARIMRRDDSAEPESKTRMVSTRPATAWRGCRSDDEKVGEDLHDKIDGGWRKGRRGWLRGGRRGWRALVRMVTECGQPIPWWARGIVMRTIMMMSDNSDNARPRSYSSITDLPSIRVLCVDYLTRQQLGLHHSAVCTPTWSDYSVHCLRWHSIAKTKNLIPLVLTQI